MKWCRTLPWILTGALCSAVVAAEEAAAPAQAPADAAAADADPQAAARDASQRGLLEAKEAQAAAVAQAARGEELFRAHQVAEAYDCFRNALALDPANEAARQGAEAARRILAARSDDLADAIPREVERVKIGEQHQQVQAGNNLEAARKLVDAAAAAGAGANEEEKAQDLVQRLGQLDQAQEVLLRAKLQLEGLPARLDATSRKNEAAQLEARIRELRAAQTAELDALNRGISARVAEQNASEVASYFQKQKEELLRQARAHRDLRQYDKAEVIIRKVMAMDPADAKVEVLLLEVQRQRRLYRDEKIRDEETEERKRVLENVEHRAIPEVSPEKVMIYPKEWDQVVKRKASQRRSGEGEDDASKAIQRKLEKRHSVEFVQANIKDVIEHLRRISQVDFIYRPPAEGGEPPEINLRLNETRLDNILRWVMTITALNYEIRNGVIFVTSAAGLAGDKVTEIYDVRDIAIGVADAGTVPGVEGLTGDGDEAPAEPESIALDEIVKRVLNADFADQGEVQVDAATGNMMVVHTREVQRKVLELLAKLRAAQAIQISVSARFLTVTDDFWEEFQNQFGSIANGSTTLLPFNNYVTGARDEDGRRKYRNPWVNNSGSYQRNNNFTSSEHFDDMYGTVEHRRVNGINSVLGANLGTQVQTATFQPGMSFLLGQRGWLGQIQAAWLIRMMKESKKADELFAPHIVVNNNKYGWILWDTRIPYIKTYVVAPAGVDLEPVVEDLHVGTALQVRPTISSDKKYITLDIYPRVRKLMTTREGMPRIFMMSNFGAISTDGAAGGGGVAAGGGQLHSLPIDLPIVFEHNARTFATMPDGGAIVISGLSINVHARGRNGIPLLQDIPILGNAFSNRSLQKEKRSFVIVTNARSILLDEEEAKQTR